MTLAMAVAEDVDTIPRHLSPCANTQHKGFLNEEEKTAIRLGGDRLHLQT